MALLDEFKYEQLDLTQPSIRVVDLLPHDYSGKIQCRLRHVSLADSSRITGVSYECGSPQSQKHQIWVNGKSFRVLDNLYVFLDNLLRLHPDDGYESLWIDALCIDQHNHLERGHQVQQMKRIYKTAANVLVWLGPSNAVSDLLFDFLITLDNPNSSENAVLSVAQMSKEQWTASQNKIIHAGIDVWRACEALSRRTYWTRTWILQEILLAQWPIMFCGSKKAPWQSWAIVLDTLGKTNTLTSCWTPTLYGSSANFICQQWFSTVDGDASDSIIKLVLKFRQSICSDQHDKVYGLLGLASNASALRVNYECGIDQLCLDLVSLLDSTINIAEFHELFTVFGIRFEDIFYLLELFVSKQVSSGRVNWKPKSKWLKSISRSDKAAVIPEEQTYQWIHQMTAIGLEWRVSAPEKWTKIDYLSKGESV